jgi:hypothetical protein
MPTELPDVQSGETIEGKIAESYHNILPQDIYVRANLGDYTLNVRILARSMPFTNFDQVPKAGEIVAVNTELTNVRKQSYKEV